MTDNVFPFRRREQLHDDLSTLHDPMCSSGLAYRTGRLDHVDEDICNCDYVRSIRSDQKRIDYMAVRRSLEYYVKEGMCQDRVVLAVASMIGANLPPDWIVRRRFEDEGEDGA